VLPDPAEVMLGKAKQDHLLAARIVDDSEVTDEHIGFFCQQAIEKAMKAVLSHRSIRYRRTHDLSELLDLLVEHRAIYPARLDECVMLTPFAVEMRYDFLPADPQQRADFDRQAAVALAGIAVEWATAIVAQT